MLGVCGRISAAILIAAGLPIHLLISLLIRLSDRGPAIYRAPRLGRHGYTYELLKYRSMKVGSKPVVVGDFKVITIQDDPRITPVGRFLRCGLDELPQLFNVVRGEMAWIGPRPDEPWMLENYGDVLRQRLPVRPGITGLAQVCDGRYLSTALSYAIDLWYIRNRSLRLDLWIILVTPLFIAGWRSVGKKRLNRLLRNPEVIEIQRECASELAAGARPFPETSGGKACWA